MTESNQQGTSLRQELRSLRAGMGEFFDGLRAIFNDGKQIWRSFLAEQTQRRTTMPVFATIDDANHFAEQMIADLGGDPGCQIQVIKPVCVDRLSKIVPRLVNSQNAIFWHPRLVITDRDGDFFCGAIVLDKIDLSLAGLRAGNAFMRLLPGGHLVFDLETHELVELMAAVDETAREMGD